MHEEALNDRWKDEAACRGEPGEWFWPPSERGSAVHDWRIDVRPLAFAVCATCPVLVECGDYAQANGETSGVWGGVDFGLERGRQSWATARRAAVRERVLRWADRGVAPVEIARLVGVSRRTVHRFLAGSA